MLVCNSDWKLALEFWILKLMGGFARLAGARVYHCYCIMTTHVVLSICQVWCYTRSYLATQQNCLVNLNSWCNDSIHIYGCHTSLTWTYCVIYQTFIISDKMFSNLDWLHTIQLSYQCRFKLYAICILIAYCCGQSLLGHDPLAGAGSQGA